MSDSLRIISDCFGLHAPDPDGAPLYHFLGGSELVLLPGGDARFFRASFRGRIVFVPKTHASVVTRPGVGLPVARATPVASATGVHEPRGRERRAPPPPPRGSSGWAKVLRGLSVFAGGWLLLSALGLMLFAAPAVISPDQDIARGFSFGIAGAVLAAAGLALVRLGLRQLLQVALFFSGLTFAIGGIEFLILAPPLSKLSRGDIDGDRAFVAFMAAGIAFTVLGLAIIVAVLGRWLRNPASRKQRADVGRWAAIVYGSLLLLTGLSFAGSTAVASEDFTRDVQQAAAAGIAFPLLVLPGAILGFHGLTMASPRLNGPFRFFPAAPLVALFAAALALGAIVVAVEEPIVWLMTSAHAAAALLPALVLIALVSRGGLGRATPIAGLSHRQLWLAFAVGIAVVTTLVGTLDSLLAQSLSMALLSANGAFDGLRTFRDVADAIQFPDQYLTDRQSIFLLLTVAAVIAPIMEEAFKGLGVALLLPRRPTPSAALALGVAVGAGFGVTEASLYGLGGLEGGGEIDWWPLMLIRAGATSMHALNTGLMGLAFYFGVAQQRYARGLLLYFAAVAIHGLWNTLAVLAGSRVIFSFESLTDRDLTIVVFAVLTPLALATLAALYVAARRAYRATPKLGEPTPGEIAAAASFEPWIGV